MSGSSSPAGPADVHVDVDDRQQAHEINTEHLVNVLTATLTSQHGQVEAEVGWAFIAVD